MYLHRRADVKSLSGGHAGKTKSAVLGCIGHMPGRCETGVEWGAVLARPAGAPQAGPGHCAHCGGGHPLGPQRLQHVAHPAQQRLQGAAGRKMQGVSSDEQGSGLTGLYNRLKTLQQLRRRQGFGPRTLQGLCRAALSASRPGLSPGGRGLGLGVCPRRRATRLASSDSSTCRGMGGPGITWHSMAWHGMASNAGTISQYTLAATPTSDARATAGWHA